MPVVFLESPGLDGMGHRFVVQSSVTIMEPVLSQFCGRAAVSGIVRGGNFLAISRVFEQVALNGAIRQGKTILVLAGIDTRQLEDSGRQVGILNAMLDFLNEFDRRIAKNILGGLVASRDIVIPCPELDEWLSKIQHTAGGALPSSYWKSGPYHAAVSRPPVGTWNGWVKRQKLVCLVCLVCCVFSFAAGHFFPKRNADSSCSGGSNDQGDKNPPTVATNGSPQNPQVSSLPETNTDKSIQDLTGYVCQGDVENIIKKTKEMNKITSCDIVKLKKEIFASRKCEDRREAYLNKTEADMDLNKLDEKEKTKVKAKLDKKESVTKKNREEIKKLLDAIYAESKVKNWDKDKQGDPGYTQDQRKEIAENFNKYEEVLRPFYPERAQFFKDWLAWKKDCDAPFMEMKKSAGEIINTKKRISAVEITGKNAVSKDGEGAENTTIEVSEVKIKNATLKISGSNRISGYKYIFENDPHLEPKMPEEVRNEEAN